MAVNLWCRLWREKGFNELSLEDSSVFYSDDTKYGNTEVESISVWLVKGHVNRFLEQIWRVETLLRIWWAMNSDEKIFKYFLNCLKVLLWKGLSVRFTTIWVVTGALSKIPNFGVKFFRRRKSWKIVNCEKIFIVPTQNVACLWQTLDMNLELMNWIF